MPQTIQKIRRVIPVCEAIKDSFDDNASEFTIKVIRAGISLNRTRYSRANLNEIASFMNDPKSLGHKLYIDHVRDTDRPERSIKDWAATVVKAEISPDDPDLLLARVRVTPHNQWVYELAKSEPIELGASVFIAAMTEKVEDMGDGQPGIDILQVVLLYSTDFVTEASAGGGVYSKDPQESYVPVESAEVDNLIIAANKIANTESRNQVVGVLESLKSEAVSAKDGDSSTAVNDGELVPFADVMKQKQNEDDAYTIYWAFWEYFRDLLFKVEGDRQERIDAAVEAVKIAMNAIYDLLEKEDDEAVTELHNRIVGSKGDDLQTETRKFIHKTISEKLGDLQKLSDLSPEVRVALGNSLPTPKTKSGVR